MAKDITTFSMEELERNPETVMRLTDCIACSEHRGEDVKYYCKDHNVPCCGACFFEGHKICSKVIDLKKDLPALLCSSKPDEIMADLKNIEIHLIKFMEFNDVQFDHVGPQINRSTDQIREVRMKINAVLDEIEHHVKAEGSRTYEEVEINKENENHQCMAVLHAVKNSQHVLETVHKHGSDLQKFLMAKKMKSQLRSYINLVGEKYEKVDTVSVKAEFSPTIQSILSVSVSELGKVVSTVGYNTLPFTGAQGQTKNCQIHIVGVVGLSVRQKPRYTGLTFIPGDRLMLIDNDNNQCVLFSSSYQFITSYSITGIPWDVCVLDNQEVAVSLFAGNNIHILSVAGDVIRLVRMIPTKYNCNGIAYAGNGEMVVNWYCGKLKSEWSLINAKGEVVHSHPYDCPYTKFNVYNHYLAMNNAKTRVLISADTMDSLLCFDMDGQKLFTYKPSNLSDPKGVAVDRYDNIYVIGQTSNNIHQLSPNGYVLQVLCAGVPTCPHAICIHESKDIIVVTSSIDQTILHIYQLA